MKCCINCFNDNFLKDFISKKNEIDNCDYCDSQNVYCIDVETLSCFFDSLIKLYDPVIDFMPLEALKNLYVIEENSLWELLQNRWDIFSSDDSKIHEAILRDMYKEYDLSEPEKYLFDEFWKDSDEYWGIDIENSDRLHNIWDGFKQDLISKNRFFPQTNINLKGLKKLLPYLKSNEIIRGYKLSRARRNSDSDLYPCNDMGKPPIRKAVPGRANPKGISYLYLASDIDTAISEIRPTFNDFITVAEFECTNDLNLIDLRDLEIESPFKLGDYLKEYLMNLVHSFINSYTLE